MRNTLKQFSTSFLLTAFLLPHAALGSARVAGTIRDESTGKPAVGDKVILLHLPPGGDEVASTKTGLTGAFALEMDDQATKYLLRIIHKGVNYEHEVSSCETVVLTVFDVVDRVSGITTGLELIQPGIRGNSLHVCDMYDVRNQSRPPVTQKSVEGFEFYVPANAQISSVLVATREGHVETAEAFRVGGEPGHYRIRIPLIPGNTKVAVNYDVAYPGRMLFQPRSAYPVAQLTVLLPVSIKFYSSSDRFRLLRADREARLEATFNLGSGSGPAFWLSGQGAPLHLNRSLDGSRPMASKLNVPVFSSVQPPAGQTQAARAQQRHAHRRIARSPVPVGYGNRGTSVLAICPHQ